MKKLLLASLCGVLTPLVSPAATLVGYDTSGNTATASGMPSPWTPQTLEANVNILSGMTRGAGLTVGSGGANTWYGSTWTKDTTDSAAKAAAISSGDYFTLSIQAASGFALSFSSLDAVNYRTSAGANNYIWQYSVGGGDFTDIGSIVTFTNTSTVSNFDAPLIDLSGISALQNVTSSVTFRMVGWATTAGNNPSGTGNLGFGNVTGNEFTLEGSVAAVPEPSTYAMLIAGAGVMFWTIRRKRKAC